jgi:hypothetical protein
MNKCEEVITFILFGAFIAFWVAVMLAAYKDTKIKHKEIKEE